MNLKDQCCKVEQAQILVQLGIGVPAMFYHMPAKGDNHGPYIRYGWHGDTLGPAYNVVELGLMVGRNFTSGIIATGFVAQCTVIVDGVPESYQSFSHSEASARARMLIWLLKNKVVTAEEINQKMCI